MIPERVRCKSCGAPIFYIPHHETGAVAPIDAAPVADGPIVTLIRAGVVFYWIVGKDEQLAADRRRYRNHFQTCPTREQHYKTTR